MTNVVLRVLVADQSESTRKVVIHLLRRTGLTLEIEEGARAPSVKVLQGFHPWDCLLIGGTLEDQSGLHWISQSRESEQDGVHPIIYLAGHPGEECLEALRAGAWDALPKGTLQSTDLYILVRRCAQYAKLQKQARWQAREIVRSNEELSRFTYVVSHDLKEPLRKVEAFGEALAHSLQGKLDEESSMYLERMRDGAQRMNGMLDALLRYAKVAQMEAGQEWTDLNSVMEYVRDTLELRLRETQAEIDCPRLSRVRGQEVLLRQLLQNLLANAIKYRHPKRAPLVRIWEESSQEQWFLHVQDNGRGFAPEQRERIFGLFHRLQPGLPGIDGHGVGLATCRRIAETLGGKIFATAVDGEGACFTVVLPRETVEIV